MIELIDQSALVNTDRSVPVLFGFRCTVCGLTFQSASHSRAEMHQCPPPARVPPVTSVAATPPAVEMKPKPRRGRPRKTPAAE